MASISLLKGPKEVLQIEFSRVFALRYAVHLIRYVQKLLLRSTHLRIVVLFIFAVLIIAYTFYSGQDRLQDSSECIMNSSIMSNGSFIVFMSIRLQAGWFLKLVEQAIVI